MSKPPDLVQGTLDLLLLKIIALSLHGWAIAQRLKQVSGDVLQVSEGSLYPALHKLEQEGWITARWQVAETGRRAKFNTLSRAGRLALDREAANWERLSGAISRAGASEGGVSMRRVVLHAAVAMPITLPPHSRRAGSRGRASAIMFNVESTPTSRGASRPPTRATPRCARSVASSNGRRSAATGAT